MRALTISMGSPEQREGASADHPDVPLPDLEFWPQLDFDPELMHGLDWLENSALGLHHAAPTHFPAQEQMQSPSPHQVGLDQAAYIQNRTGGALHGPGASATAPNSLAAQPVDLAGAGVGPASHATPVSPASLEALGHLHGNLFADIPGGAHIINQLVHTEDL